jgi:hypothetical protein
MIPLKRAALGIPSWQYVLYALLLSALVRVVLTFFKCYRLTHENAEGSRSFVRYFLRAFVGLSHAGVNRRLDPEEKERVRGDCLTAYVLGVLELAIFPFLFAAELHAYVGAWIGLKVVAQYKHWADDRGLFTAFLVGNMASSTARCAKC